MNYSALKDEELVLRIVNNGEADAYGVLYDRYAQKVYAKCITFVKSEQAAEDLTHDIFLKAFLKLSTFKREAAFSTWFYSLTYNACIDYVRKSSRNKTDDFIDVEQIEEKRVKIFQSDSEERLLYMEVKELDRVLDILKPKDKMILLMKYQDDMSIADIGKEMDLGESAVKMRLFRARERAVVIHHNLFKSQDDD